MSQARVYTTKGPVRKDGLKCGKCGDSIRKGIDRRITFAVGFRGYEQTRCLKPECYPTRSELESSLVGEVYGAIDGINIDDLTSTDDFTSARDEIAEACSSVADEYENNEMYEINYDLQERAEQVRSAADSMGGWEPEEEEPDEDDEKFNTSECTDCDGTGRVPDTGSSCEECSGTGTIDAEEDFETAHGEWVDQTHESFQNAIDELELP